MKYTKAMITKRELMRAMDYEFYEEIWNERAHFSQISGKPLPYSFSPSMFFVFSHILTKQAYPKFRHRKENVVLMTFEEHRDWEDGKVAGPQWYTTLLLKEKLKCEYNGQVYNKDNTL